MTATPGVMMTLAQAFALLQPRIPAARLVGDGATPLARVHTDTRTLQAGDLFVALKGERFDANAFLPDARAGGAAAAIAHGGLAAAGLPKDQRNKECTKKSALDKGVIQVHWRGPR